MSVTRFNFLKIAIACSSLPLPFLSFLLREREREREIFSFIGTGYTKTLNEIENVSFYLVFWFKILKAYLWETFAEWEQLFWYYLQTFLYSSWEVRRYALKDWRRLSAVKSFEMFWISIFEISVLIFRIWILVGRGFGIEIWNLVCVWMYLKSTLRKIYSWI